MEFLKRFRSFGEKENSTNQQEPKLLQSCKRRGRRFCQEKMVDAQLPLEEKDQIILHLFVGLKLLNDKIEKSKFPLLGYAHYTGGFYGHKKDTSKTIRLREEFGLTQELIESFISANYEGSGLNRVRNIQMAINMLFAQTQYVSMRNGRANQQLTPQAISDWANEWKPRITATETTSQ